MLLALAGCETSSTLETSAAPPGGVVAVRVQPCVDRTGRSERDLGSEATAGFVTALDRSASFRTAPEARYVLNCEVSTFLPGNAFKRWLLPGWGATVGQVAAMVADSQTGQTVLIVRGNATVSAGGLYSIGADSYILRVAIDDAVAQMVKWARGNPNAAVRGDDASPARRPS